MLERVRNVCVVGAGTMGTGIAAHLANIGFQVTLLDTDEDTVRHRLKTAKNARPPHFYLPDTADTIRPGSITENIDAIAEADWVCEAIVEKLDAKKNLFAQIEPLLKPGALVSTNTSGLQISLLAEGRSPDFRARFLGTHFFNPPRYLKLLELVPTPDTDPLTLQNTTRFLEQHAARRVVAVKDTPGFIANRYGMWSMYYATHVTEKLGFTVEMADAITGPFIGRPNSASFRLNDIVGLDIMQDIAQNLVERCPHDPATKHLANPKSLQYLLDKGWIGSKAGQGYYRKESDQFLSLDLMTFAYRERLEPELPTLHELGRIPFGERLRQALAKRDEVGEFLRQYLVPTLAYATRLAPEISHNIDDFDRVMRWGFGWQHGPFETIDAIGAETLAQYDPAFQPHPYYLLPANHTPETAVQIRAHDGSYYNPRPEPDYQTIHQAPLIAEHPGFNVRDLGDQVHAIALTTKMGVIDPPTVASLAAYLQSGQTTRFVLTSEAKVFSAGFDLRFFVQAIEENRLQDVEKAIQDFQTLNTTIGQIPSVAAVFGFCIGGGFELAAGCSHIAAAPETQIGLPEAKVGLIPGGAGTALMRLRAQEGGAKSLVKMLEALAQGQLSANSDHARALHFLRREDHTIYHPDRLLQDAKYIALQAKTATRPEWADIAGPLRGMADTMQQELQSKHAINEYDKHINDKAKAVFARPTSFEEAVALERELFLELCQDGRSLARMKHMLETNKPLRN